MKVTRKQARIIAGLKNEDPQGRTPNGEYPRPDVPDYIEVFDVDGGILLRVEYKDTEPKTAAQHTADLISKALGVKYDGKIVAEQFGDFVNDWVKTDVYFEL